MKIVQTSKCKTSLGRKKDIDPALLKGFKIPYSNQLRYTVPTTWNEEVFSSIDPVVCPITSCT